MVFSVDVLARQQKNSRPCVLCDSCLVIFCGCRSALSVEVLWKARSSETCLSKSLQHAIGVHDAELWPLAIGRIGLPQVLRPREIGTATDPEPIFSSVRIVALSKPYFSDSWLVLMHFYA